jgi:hypothetical protein
MSEADSRGAQSVVRDGLRLYLAQRIWRAVSRGSRQVTRSVSEGVFPVLAHASGYILHHPGVVSAVPRPVLGST